MEPMKPEDRVDTLVKWLIEREGMLRPPVVAAKFLIFCVELQRANRPFPPRAEVAAELGCSVSSVDAILNQRLATGDISIGEVILEDGNVKRRVSTIRRKTITVSPEIVQVVTG